jgi:predicted phosphodiesterase
MVKLISKIFISALSLAIVCFTIGCDLSVDLPGLFASNDLDERLLEKNNFQYLRPDERNFKTAVRDPSDPSLVTPTPAPDPDDPSALDSDYPYKYSFIVMTDTHVEDGNISDLEKIGAEIKGDVTFLTNLGDISQYGSEQDITAVMKYYRALNIPCYPVVGNHDIYSHSGVCNWPVWQKYIGSTRYRVNGEIESYQVTDEGLPTEEKKVVHVEYFTLFVLDSANAFIGKSQLDWLEKELKTAKGTVFVLTHSDLFVQDKIKIQQLYDPAERARIMSLLRNNNDKCKMMLMGHSHEWVEKDFGNVRYISIDDYKSTQKFLLVTVRNGEVSYKLKKL